MKKPYIIGICGGSASGKTFLLRKLQEHFNSSQIALISQDNYYKKKELQKLDDIGRINFDHPDSLDLDACARDVERLINGESIDIEEYTFNDPNRIPQIFHYSPTPIIIIEGILIYHNTTLADLMDLKIFVDADEHLRLIRRLKRDVVERNYPFEDTIVDYERYVAPMYKQFVEPTKYSCDVIIMNNQHLNNAMQMLVNHIAAILKD